MVMEARKRSESATRSWRLLGCFALRELCWHYRLTPYLFLYVCKELPSHLLCVSVWFSDTYEIRNISCNRWPMRSFVIVRSSSRYVPWKWQVCPAWLYSYFAFMHLCGTYIHTYIHTMPLVHTYIHTYIHTCLTNDRQSSSYVHTYIKHTYIHTMPLVQIHTCLRRSSSSSYFYHLIIESEEWPRGVEAYITSRFGESQGMSILSELNSIYTNFLSTPQSNLTPDDLALQVVSSMKKLKTSQLWKRWPVWPNLT